MTFSWPETLESQKTMIRCETLRDKFAMAALQGLLAAPDHGFISLEVHVSNAYRAADLAIKHRRQSTDDHVKNS